MNSIDFCYWLQGYFELSGSDELTTDQVKIIRNHLNLAFTHEIDAIYDNNDLKVKEALKKVHDGNNPVKKNPMGNDILFRC